MAETPFPVKKALIILAIVAVVAVTAAVLTAEHIGPMTLLIVALVAGVGGFVMYAWIAGEAKKLQKQAPPEKKEE